MHRWEEIDSRISVSFRSYSPSTSETTSFCSEIGEPAVVVKNLPVDAKKGEISKLLPTVSIQRLWINKYQDTAEAVVVVDSEQSAEFACLSLARETIRGNQLEPSVSSIQDVGFQVSFDNSNKISEQDLAAHFYEEPVSVTFTTDAKSLVGFKSLDDARRALSAFQVGNILPIEGAYGKLSVLPSYVVEVDGLQEDVSVDSLLETLKQNDLTANPIKTNRNAIVKFRRNMDVSYFLFIYVLQNMVCNVFNRLFLE